MARHGVALNRNTNWRLLLKLGRYHGVYAVVAKRLRREKSHVRRVALGQRRSKHIEQALLREIQRIEKLASKAA